MRCRIQSCNLLAEECVFRRLCLRLVDGENYILEQERSAVAFDRFCPQIDLERQCETLHVVVSVFVFFTTKTHMEGMDFDIFPDHLSDRY